MTGSIFFAAYASARMESNKATELNYGKVIAVTTTGSWW